MSPEFDTLLSRLPNPKKVNSTTYECRCPAHADKDPSLRVTLAPSGVILLHCFSGCPPQDVLDSIGMSFGDLYPEGAISNHFRGWHPSNKDRAKVQHCRTVLEIAKEQVSRGETLDSRDYLTAREAYTYLQQRDLI